LKASLLLARSRTSIHSIGSQLLTQSLLYTQLLTTQSLAAQSLLYTQSLTTQSLLYTQSLVYAQSLTTQSLVYTQSLATQSLVYTQSLATQSLVYTQSPLNRFSTLNRSQLLTQRHSGQTAAPKSRERRQLIINATVMYITKNLRMIRRQTVQNMHTFALLVRKLRLK